MHVDMYGCGQTPSYYEQSHLSRSATSGLAQSLRFLAFSWQGAYSIQPNFVTWAVHEHKTGPFLGNIRLMQPSFTTGFSDPI